MKHTIKEKKGVKHQLSNLLQDPSLLIILISIFVLFGLFIIYPFLKLALIPSLDVWIEAITSKNVITAFRNTLFSSIIASVSATVLGFIFAYAMNYTNIIGKRIFRVIVLLPNMAPSVMTGLAFIMLFGRRGLITYNLLGMNANPYGWFGLWIVQTIAFFPLAYITISGILRSVSPNVELAAQNLGASGFTLFKTVTLKLAMPGIVNAFLLVFINSLADFGNPMLIGGNYQTLATLSYATVTGTWNLPLAASLSLFLVIPSISIFFLQKYYLDKKSYVTVTGKPTSGLNRDFVSSKMKVLLFIFCILISGLITLIVGVVIAFAITETFGVNYALTTQHLYDGIINSYTIKNSWKFSIIAAIITSILGVILAYLNSRKEFPGKSGLDFIAMLPVSLPGTFIGLALVMAFNEKPILLTGTVSIVVIGMIIRQLPVGYRNAMAGFKQIDKSIEEASTNLGASSVKSFRTIVMPMLKNQISITFVYSFMKCMNTLSTVIFLVSPKSTVASVNILSLADHGFYGIASATAIGMMVIILLTFGVAKLLLKDNIRIFDL